MVEVEALEPLHNVVGCHQLRKKLFAEHVAGGAVFAVVALIPASLGPAVVGLLLRHQTHYAAAFWAALFT